jgi:nucleotide-binding universal stress UspA family protein
VPALFVEKRGAAAEMILETAQEQAADLIIMGGYGRGKLKNLVLGISVDQVLRESNLPMLICRQGIRPAASWRRGFSPGI